MSSIAWTTVNRPDAAVDQDGELLLAIEVDGLIASLREEHRRRP